MYTSSSATSRPHRRLLIVNPNSTQNMTIGVQRMVHSLGPSPIFDITFYTAPSGPTSINSSDDAAESSDIVIRDLISTGSLEQFDAFLVSCYSIHPLISKIKENVKASVPVTGIFEASIGAALMLLPQQAINMSYTSFGIISTGSYWEKELSDGVFNFLGVDRGDGLRTFKGVRTTGLSATELHDVNQDTVKSRVKAATRSLVSGNECKVVILGCAGMAGMEEWVSEAILEELGKDMAEFVTIVDGVKAGLVYLEGAMRILPGR